MVVQGEIEKIKMDLSKLPQEFGYDFIDE